VVLTLAVSTVLSGCAAPQTGSRPPPSTQPPPEQPAPAPTPPATPAPAPAPRSDASAPTLALVLQSERSARDGDLESAIAYVERAIRLNSRDASLWLRLARLQLDANRPASAEQIAQRAIALAGNVADQQRRGWLLVAEAREAQGDDDAAAAFARADARSGADSASGAVFSAPGAVFSAPGAVFSGR
jgi:tetratricopeptide (TPR) repeat protein